MKSLPQYTNAQWRDILYNDPCPYCGAKSDSLEHVVAREGDSRSSIKRNPRLVVGACSRCNLDKGSMPLLWYLFLRQKRDAENQTWLPGQKKLWAPMLRTLRGWCQFPEKIRLQLMQRMANRVQV